MPDGQRHTCRSEIRATCTCGWKSQKVFNDADVSANHRKMLIDWAAHNRAAHG